MGTQRIQSTWIPWVKKIGFGTTWYGGYEYILHYTADQVDGMWVVLANVNVLVLIWLQTGHGAIRPDEESSPI